MGIIFYVVIPTVHFCTEVLFYPLILNKDPTLAKAANLAKRS